ncbi:MAG: DUF1772 domain-containing protein [Ferruginibacter sp.]
MNFQIARIASLLLTGLIAGTFFYGTFTVIPTFYGVPHDIHLSFRTALMRHNAIIVMSMVVLSIVALAFYTWQACRLKIARGLILMALILTITSLVITRLGSVPINMQIKTWNISSPPADWLKILDTWDKYNLIRTVASIASFICLLIADLWLIKSSSVEITKRADELPLRIEGTHISQ